MENQELQDINDCTLDIKSFLKIDPSVSEDFSSQVVGKIYRIELRLPDGTNYLHARSFEDEPGLVDALQLVDQIKEKGKINMIFWKEDEPVYGSKRYLQREPEMVALEKQREREESFGPRM